MLCIPTRPLILAVSLLLTIFTIQSHKPNSVCFYCVSYLSSILRKPRGCLASDVFQATIQSMNPSRKAVINPTASSHFLLVLNN